MPAADPHPPALWLVLNGKAAGEDAVREAVAALRGQGHAVAVRVTWEDGDAARYVAEALEAGAATLALDHLGRQLRARRGLVPVAPLRE